MNNKIPTPKISEILLEEFMKPKHLSVDDVAKGTSIPISHIQNILHDQCKINFDISVKLGNFFGVSDRFFINLQNDIERRQANLANSDK